jgi:hypothetical protein
VSTAKHYGAGSRAECPTGSGIWSCGCSSAGTNHSHPVQVHETFKGYEDGRPQAPPQLASNAEPGKFAKTRATVGELLDLWLEHITRGSTFDVGSNAAAQAAARPFARPFARAPRMAPSRSAPTSSTTRDAVGVETTGPNSATCGATRPGPTGVPAIGDRDLHECRKPLIRTAGLRGFPS